MGKRQISRLLSIILCVAMIMTTSNIPLITPNVAFAAPTAPGNEKTTPATPEPQQVEKAKEPSLKEKLNDENYEEIVDKRQLSTKYYRLESGKYEAVKYGYPVHYKENGKLLDIDNTLVESNDKSGNKVYTNKANDFKVELYDKTDTFLASISKGDYKISWNVDGLSKDVAASADTYITKEKWNSLPKGERRRNVPGISSKAEYKGAVKGGDVQLILLSNMLKQNFVLSEYNGLSEYTEQLHVEGLILTTNKDGSIVAMDEKDQKTVVFKLKTPFAEDAEGNIAPDIKVTMEQSGDYDYILTYTLDDTWLQKASYPVTVDPSITTSLADSDIDDTRLAEGLPTQNYCDSYIMCTGYGSSSHANYSLVKFRNMPVLGQANMIVYAGYRVKLAGTYGTSTVSVHNVTSNWTNSTVTWNTKPSFDNIVEDYCVVGGTEGVTSEWDITHIAKKWYNGGANYGLLLKDTSNQTDNSNYKSWYTCDATYGDVPYAYFVYVDYSGLEDYWDYASSDIGRGGQANVNLYNGNLVYTHTDLSMTGERMPVTVTRTFNSTLRNNGAAWSFSGNGWMTNYDQYIYETVISGTEYYLYRDGDGTIHYFKQYDGIWKDESGLDTKLSYTGSRYEMVDKQNNKLCFDNAGKLICLIDNNGNQQTVNRNSSSQIISITDGSGRIVTLERNADGSLYRIKDPANRYVTTYTYASSRLTRITYADGNYTSFTYDSNGNLTTATNFDGNKVTITYSSASPYRISRIEESNGSTLGGRLDFVYGLNLTTVTDVQGRKAQYQFNDSGNTVCAVAPDGSAQYTKFGTNINGATSNDVNKITSVSKTQKFSNNALLNSNFETDSVWSLASRSGSIGTHTYTTTQKYMGDRSMQLTKTNTNYYEYAREAISLEKGKTYTLSAYIKTDNVSVSSKGAFLEASYYDSTGTEISVLSDFITGTNDWNRYSVTFTVPADSTSNTVYVYLLLWDSTGTAWFDCVQVEEGFVANRYNIIENADFNSYTGNIPTFWTRTNLDADDTMDITTDSSNPSFLSDAKFKMTGNCVVSDWMNLQQAFPISGNTGDTFVFGGWTKGNSVPINKESGRQFLIQLTFHYTDGTLGYNTALCNEDSSAWQYVSNAGAAKKPYSSISIELAYTGNANVAYFDGISLFKEEFGNTFSYDANGNLVSTKDAEKKTESFQYTNNDLAKYVKPNNSEYNYAYDNHHNLTSATSSQNLVYSYGYDAYGNNTESKVGNSSVYIRSTVSYDSNGNYVDVVRDPFNKSLNYDYNTSKGTLSQITDQLQNTTTYSYDPNLDRLTGASETASGVTLSNSYTYDDDRISTVSHNAPGGSVTYSFDYDALGRNIGTNVGSMDLVTYSLQARTGRLESVTYGNGQAISYVYDDYDRLNRIVQNSARLYYFGYDNSGNVGYLKDYVQGVEYRYEYDSMERVGKVLMDDGSNPTFIRYGYNNVNNLTTVEANMGNMGSFTSSYAYDNDDRPTTATVGNLSTQYNYDATLGLTTSYELKNGGSSVYTTSLGYVTPTDQTISTRSGRVGTITNQKTGGTAETQTMQYDARGFITEIRQDANNYSQYRYDGFGQLTRENYKWGGTSFTRIYTYDVGGNMTMKTTYEFAEGDTTPTVQTRANGYWYDATWKDKLAGYNGRDITYDAIGNPTAYNGWTYTWTQGRKLQQAANASISASYKYNASGIRTEKTVNGVTTKYTLDGDKVLWEKSSDSATPIMYYYDGSGKLFGLKYNGTDYFYVRNVQGDIIKIVDTSGNTQVQYLYDAWGYPQSITGNLASTLGQANPYRYRGYRYDNETGLYYLQSRYYNPVWGRFLNADSVGGNTGKLLSHNPFVYCSNNSVNKYDPSGHWEIDEDDEGNIIRRNQNGTTSIVKKVSSSSKLSWKQVGLPGYGGYFEMVLNGSQTQKLIKELRGDYTSNAVKDAALAGVGGVLSLVKTAATNGASTILTVYSVIDSSVNLYNCIKADEIERLNNKNGNRGVTLIYFPMIDGEAPPTYAFTVESN